MAGSLVLPIHATLSFTMETQLGSFLSQTSNRSALLTPLRDQLRKFHAPGRLPQALEVIKLARLLGKDVNYEINIIEQHPVRLLVSLDLIGPHSGLFQTILHLVRNCLHLTWIAAAADQEIIGECPRSLFQFQYGDFFRLFFQAGADGLGDLEFRFVLLSHYW